MDSAKTTPTVQTKEGLRPAPLFDIIHDVATAFRLPTELVAAIVDVESTENPFAFRWEQAFFDRYVKPNAAKIKAISPCSLATEIQARAFSWGPMQVMGQTARELGFTGPFLSALCSPITGLTWGCTLLSRLRDRYPDEPWAVICRAYNGGPGNRNDITNPYPNKILAKLGGTWPPKERT